METTAATVEARGGNNGGSDNNDDNGVIAIVINLNLHTAGMRWYVARLNLTGGVALSLCHLQNDGNCQGWDPLGSNKFLEEKEDNINSNGTPSGAPDSTATVRRQ